MHAARATSGVPNEPERYAHPEEATALPKLSPRLAAALRKLSAYSLRDPDATLDELRVALMGTGFTWSADHKLACSKHRMALVHELDEVIGAYGKDARAAELFL